MTLTGIAVRALIAGLCVAATAAIAALLTGDFSDTHTRIVATSLGWGACALAALCGSQASLVLRGQRRGDSPLVSALVWTSIVTATFVTVVGVLYIVELVDDVSDAVTRLVAVVLVLTVLTTALPPIMRRLNRSPAASPRSPLTELADQLSAAAGRVERVETPADARREAAALRELADRARG